MSPPPLIFEFAAICVDSRPNGFDLRLSSGDLRLILLSSVSSVPCVVEVLADEMFFLKSHIG